MEGNYHVTCPYTRYPCNFLNKSTTAFVIVRGAQNIVCALALMNDPCVPCLVDGAEIHKNALPSAGSTDSFVNGARGDAF